MIWLVAQMWTWIAVAALFGLLFGWGFRGLRLKAAARRAMVERDVAFTELNQVRSELDGLYAAQRKGIDAASEAGDAVLRQELEAREAKMQRLTDALAQSRQELQVLHQQVETQAAVPVSAASPSNSNERLDVELNPAGAELAWRNRYLESRVRSLETLVGRQADTIDAQTTAEPAVQEAPSPEAAPVAPALDASAGEVEDADADVARTRWQNMYLRKRLAYLESFPPKTRDATGVDDLEDTVDVADTANVDEVETEPDRVETVNVEAAEPEAPGTPAEIEQELARLRWRNRYLESRLAYIDGDAQRGEGKPQEASADTGESESPKLAGASTLESAIDTASQTSPTPVDAFLAAVEAGDTIDKPDSMVEPEDSGDDLTRIRGINAGLQRTLNDLGIWRFSQIAGWNDSNVAWVVENVPVDETTDCSDWVKQAAVLAVGGGSA